MTPATSDNPVSPAASLINCSQCGAELHPDEGQIFVTCASCAATVYLDRSRVVFHWYVAPTLDDRQAEGALFRWMSGSQTIKDLDKKARVVGHSFEYFPLWYFKRQGARGEEVLLQPAAATSITELRELRLPAGDLRKYDDALNPQAHPPTVPLEAALEWSSLPAPSAPASSAAPAVPGALPLPGSIGPAPASSTYREAALVHVPLHFFKYSYRGGTYTAVVDAASGTVLASLFPAKQEAPYRLVGAVTALVYLLLALIPIFMSGADMMLGLLVCGGFGLLAAPFLFFWAFWVASRV